MAFFGITSLGPPNAFSSSLINALGNLITVTYWLSRHQRILGRGVQSKFREV